MTEAPSKLSRHAYQRGRLGSARMGCVGRGGGGTGSGMGERVRRRRDGEGEARRAQSPRGARPLHLAFGAAAPGRGSLREERRCGPRRRGSCFARDPLRTEAGSRRLSCVAAERRRRCAGRARCCTLAVGSMAELLLLGGARAGGLMIRLLPGGLSSTKAVVRVGLSCWQERGLGGRGAGQCGS